MLSQPGNLELVAVTRSGAPGRGVSAGQTDDPRVTHVSADVTRPDGLDAVGGAFDGVVYSVSPARGDDRAYRDCYVTGLGNVLGAKALSGNIQSGRTRVLVTTSTAVYGQLDGQWVDEASVTEPLNFRGERMLQAEALLFERAKSAVSLRLGGIYGPGRDRLVRELLDGQAALSPEDGPRVNRIHRDDCAGALAHLLRSPQPDRVYLGVDSEPASRNAVLRHLAEVAGVNLPVSEAAVVRGRGGDKRCRNASLLKSGYVFQHPTFREGYSSVLRALER